MSGEPIDYSWEFCSECDVDHLDSDAPSSCTVEDLKKKVNSLKATIVIKDDEMAAVRRDIKLKDQEFTKVIEVSLGWESIRRGSDI